MLCSSAFHYKPEFLCAACITGLWIFSSPKFPSKTSVPPDIKTELLAFNAAGISLWAWRGCSADGAVSCVLGEAAWSRQMECWAGTEKPSRPHARPAAQTDRHCLTKDFSYCPSMSTLCEPMWSCGYVTRIPGRAVASTKGLENLPVKKDWKSKGFSACKRCCRGDLMVALQDLKGGICLFTGSRRVVVESPSLGLLRCTWIAMLGISSRLPIPWTWWSSQVPSVGCAVALWIHNSPLQRLTCTWRAQQWPWANAGPGNHPELLYTRHGRITTQLFFWCCSKGDLCLIQLHCQREDISWSGTCPEKGLACCSKEYTVIWSEPRVSCRTRMASVRCISGLRSSPPHQTAVSSLRMKIRRI